MIRFMIYKTISAIIVLRTSNPIINTQHEEHALFINGITCITGPVLAWFRVVGERVGSFKPDKAACCLARKACSSSA